MISPGMMPAPPSPTYPTPAYVPQRPAPPYSPPNGGGKGTGGQPKTLIRAQAPEEPRPAHPPLLTLPPPEQLGVAVRPVEDAADGTALHARMKELGILRFHIDSLPDGRARFTCWTPSTRPGVTRCIESVAATEAEAVQRGLQEAARTKP
jgi:hypothetical protein